MRSRKWKLTALAVFASGVGPMAAWTAACGGEIADSSMSGATASDGASSSGSIGSGNSTGSNSRPDGALADVGPGMPSCNDLSKNNDETDVDCGGSACGRCSLAKKCKLHSDCASGACRSDTCSCPANMAAVARQGGAGVYCIDEIEVTKAQYSAFLYANVNIDNQISVCKPPTNYAFVPRAAWPPIESAQTPQPLPSGGATAFNMSLPVHYVDWCDAYAYCKWANKQLCGSVTGGTVAPALADSPNEDAWMNACSAGGANTWPHGNVFDGRCNGTYHGSDGGGPIPQYNGYGFAINQDEGVHQVNNGDVSGNYDTIHFAECAGGVPGLYHMSGNVAEWEDSCDGTAADSKCRVRGGSFFAQGDSTTLSCKGNRSEQRVPPDLGNPDTDVLRDVGFRCCLY
jgi:formylglycine-generating enzyme required for sulfatase activity